MPSEKRKMALTADLVAAAARVVEDLGPSPGAVYMTDEDYEIAIWDTLAQGPPGDVYLFGYGSLLWKPACEIAESRRAIVDRNLWRLQAMVAERIKENGID